MMIDTTIAYLMYRIVDKDPRDALLWRKGSGNTVEIYDISVMSVNRRKGIGRRLVNKLMLQIPKETKLVWAITRSNNLIAQEFYEALGFRTIGLLQWFYQDEVEGPTVDAIMYGKDVSSRKDVSDE